MKIGKTLGGLLLSALAALGFAGAAQAVETFTHDHGTLLNPSDDVLLGLENPTYGHTWTNLFGSDPSQWSVVSADLSFVLRDDRGLFDSCPIFPNTCDGQEQVRFYFNGANWDTENVDGIDVFGFDLDGVDFSAGLFSWLLERRQGDFYFSYAHLTIQAARRVSEPGTLLMLGMALMGLGFVARRRAR